MRHLVLGDTAVLLMDGPTAIPPRCAGRAGESEPPGVVGLLVATEGSNHN